MGEYKLSNMEEIYGVGRKRLYEDIGCFAMKIAPLRSL